MISLKSPINGLKTLVLDSLKRGASDFRQLAASFMICSMLLPILSLPVQASNAYSAARIENELEPVNEDDVSVLQEIWRDAASKFEAWSTPLRVANIEFEAEVNKVEPGDTNSLPDDDKKAKDKTKEEKASDGNEINPDTDKPIKSAEPASQPAKLAVKPIVPTASAMLNQLPEDEHESVYSAQNNLGSPPGQTEMDSPNQPATMRIKHRVGTANFNFGLPLASLAGRGLDAGVAMSYNSRTWNKSQTYNATTQTYEPHFTYDVEQSWIAPGFSSGLGYLESQAVVRYKHPLQSSNFQYHTEITPMGVTDPDGTRHQMGCVEYNIVFPGTYTTSCKTYRTSDGTFIKTPAKTWKPHNPTNSQTPNTSDYPYTGFTVSYPNGSEIYYGGAMGSGLIRKHYPTLIRDSNGNRIQIAYKSDQSGRIDYIFDTLGRRIKFYYENDTNGNPDKLVAVTIPGMGTNEEIQTVRFYYEDDFALNSTNKFTGQITAPATVRILKYVYMPTTKTGFKYDYHSNYGMIKKITRLAGMIVSDPTSLTTTGIVTDDGISAATTEYNFPDGSTTLADVPKYTKRTDDWQGRTATNPQETFYHVPDPVSSEVTSQITVRDTNLDIVTENVSYSDGTLKETSIDRRYGPINPSTNSRPYAQPMSKSKFTWSGGDARNLTKLEATNEAGLTKATAFEYDVYNNQTAVKEYDYAAAGTLGTLLRTTETTYETGTGWITANLFGLAKSVKTIVGGVTVSKSLIEYDHNGSDASLVRRDDIDITSHDVRYNPAYPTLCQRTCMVEPTTRPCDGSFAPEPDPEADPEDPAPEADEDGCQIHYTYRYSPASAYRGNVTKVTSFSDATLTTDPNADVTEYNYDIAGNNVSATLSCCNLKTIAYDKANEYAFPITETKGSSPQLTNSATYNRNTGLVLTSTNEDGQVTTYEYETDTLRTKKTIAPNGGYTETEYSDKLVTNVNDLLPGFVRQTTTLDTNKTTQSYSYFNGSGLGIRTATQTPDGWSIAAVEHDTLGRVRKSYNSFYGTTPTSAVPVGTKFTELTDIDALGRMAQVKLQDLTTVSTVYSNVTTTPAGFKKTFVTTTDQAGKQKRQVSDSLDRVVRVDEPDTFGSMGAVDAPTQPTFYEYDGNDNLVKIIQSDGTTTQERKFKYDSLSRLTHEKQVEADPTLDSSGVHGSFDTNKWTKVLKYNVDGLLTEGTDARGVKTTFAYDGLNRVASVTFTDGTPTVTYTYDQARSGFYNHGALTRVETATGDPVLRPDTPATATEFDYDLMGRTVKQRQSIGTQTYAMEYGYNLAGQLVNEKYPSGRVVTNGYDANGRLTQIADATRAYLNSVQYQGAGGALSSMSLGNGTTQTFSLNDRLQMMGQELKRGSEVLQKYDYGYGELDSNGVLKNNGKLESVVSHIGTAKQWTQKFKYDPLGRLSEAEERRGDTDAVSYKQKFDFDRFGNMYRKASSNPATGQENPRAFEPIEDSDISKSTNRFTADTTYDTAGNVTFDSKFRDSNFAYDANCRMIKTTRANVPDTLSVYDANGLRVAEKVNDVWRFLIYNLGGKMIAEYGGPQPTDEEGVKYVVSDWQGSVRAIVGKTGFVKSRADYTAFGEDVSSGTGVRTAQQGFGSSNSLRQKYGLTERDDATGLDHTWFRKHENQAGRWTSPDPYNGSASIAEPQSWNRYAYVENQPTNYIDPSGLNMAYGGYSWSCWVTWRSDGDGSNFQITSVSCQTWSNDSGGGGGPTDPVKFKKELYKQYADKINKCTKEVFGEGIAKKLGQQTFENSPDIDGTKTMANLGALSDNPSQEAAGLPFPTKGKFGTVGINSSTWNYEDEAAGDPGVQAMLFVAQARIFTHELGNILSYRATKTDKTKGDYYKFGDPNGLGTNKDKDSGAKFEKCVFGSNL